MQKNKNNGLPPIQCLFNLWVLTVNRLSPIQRLFYVSSPMVPMGYLLYNASFNVY